jgi:hypothetical protein
MENESELIRQAWLGQDGRAADPVRRQRYRGILATGKNDDRNPTSRGVFFYFLDELPPASTADELEVRDDRIGMFLLQLVQGTPGVRRSQWPISGVAEAHGVHRNRIGAVVNEKD